MFHIRNEVQPVLAVLLIPHLQNLPDLREVARTQLLPYMDPCLTADILAEFHELTFCDQRAAPGPFFNEVLERRNQCRNSELHAEASVVPAREVMPHELNVDVVEELSSKLGDSQFP